MNTDKPNHLIDEKSPYLLQHVYNPVEWYPWGEDAFEKARRENKPILVSIGYSTCHWCHVMEKESFSDPAIAAVMNENLVAIKVDREERPDVDKIYMTAVQVMTGQGGWPLNVFLTPELKPFYGGTYFPPETRWGRMGWPELVRQVGRSWSDPAEREKIRASAENLTANVGGYFAGRAEEGELNVSVLKKGIKTFEQDYDPVLGGFGGAPKFPMPVNHVFLLSCRTPETLAMAVDTLKAMARGGIYDQLGGGFSRYSTDEKWHVPHFEKMLYDNAQLAKVYLDAYALSGDGFLADIARETLDYVLRDMTHPRGGFYSAEDADSLPPELAGKVEDRGHEHRTEGAFYIWKKNEILKILGNEDGGIFSFIYGAREHGNAESDPQGEFSDRNILYLAHSIGQAAAEFKTSDEKVLAAIENGKRKLFQARALRPRPQRDEKILSAWNGLMISAFARGWQVLGEPRYLEAARKAGRFIRSELYDESTGRLYRRWMEGDKKVAGMSDDYVFFARACLDLYESDFDIEWYRLSERLMGEVRDRFYDPARPGLFMAEKSSGNDLILRARDDADNVEPSAASVAVENALKLSRFTGREEWRRWAEGILRASVKSMQQNPRAHPRMLAALSAWLSKPVEILLAGKTSGPELDRFLRSAYLSNLPGQVLIVIQDRWRAPKEFPWAYEMVKAQAKELGPVTAYVCLDYACRLPTADPEEFRRLIAPPPVDFCRRK